MNRVMGVVAVLLLVAVSCGDNGNPQSSSEGQFLAIVSGDAQEVESGVQLPLPLTVLMTDAQGRPVAGRRVDFSVVDGDAELSVAVATTDESGHVTTVLTMGDKVGEVRVRAQAFGSGQTRNGHLHSHCRPTGPPGTGWINGGT